MKTIPVFQADQHKIFLYETTANELALAPGQYNVPYLAYRNAPPAVPAGMLARYVEADSDWRLEVDNRDKEFYVVESGAPYSIGTSVLIDGSNVMYDGGGDVPAWLTDVKPVVEEVPEPESE